MSFKAMVRGKASGQLGWSLLSELYKLGSSFLLFVLVARTLGIADYGLFAGCFAIVASVAPFANLGAGHVMIRSISRDEHVWLAASSALTRVVVGASLGLAVILVLGYALLPNLPIAALLAIAIAELLGTAVTDLMAQFAFARGRARSAANVRLLVSSARLLAALSLFVLSYFGIVNGSLLLWASLYLVASLSASFLALLFVRPAEEGLFARVRPKEIFVGIPFSLNISAAYIQDDIDKTLILRFEGPTVAGFYAAGYRILNFAFVPLQAALNIIYPRFFRAASEGEAAAWKMMKGLLLPAVIYGFVVGSGLYVASFLVAPVLGTAYTQASAVIQLLIWLPLIRALDYALADYCTVMNAQWLRVVVQAFGAVMNVAMNVVLIPRLGWHGAIWASVISELATLGLLALAASSVHARRRAR